jgi:hypothetical protein
LKRFFERNLLCKRQGITIFLLIALTLSDVYRRNLPDEIKIYPKKSKHKTTEKRFFQSFLAKFAPFNPPLTTLCHRRSTLQEPNQPQQMFPQHPEQPN